MLRRFCAIALASCSLAPNSSLGADYRPPRKDLGFTVYTNAPSGRQLSGQHAPASTPALSPEAAQRKFTVPDGFEIRLFASEPEVVNPVAMTWDERGRLWVVELYEYPLGAKPGEKPRDRIKILEDTDADGRVDKVHVWADGLNLATGILLGHGGAFVGQAPHLLFLRDTDGDDRADKTEIVKTGFGLEDRHELLNGFTWGPDGQLYMTHGVFTRSKVVAPNEPADDPVLLTAGVARFNLQTKKFEIYAEGTSNPWGVDFDRTGNAYVSACVIEHLFHLVPGGLYDRQAGTPPHPYAYESLHAINDHKHHMAAYAGIQVYQGNQFPTENSGTILQGNIHDNAVHQDVLKPNGSSFVASHWRDLVRANDGWFMPVSTQVGPDGAVWIMDWYDRYPCYQNANADPAGVDREHGRIWRVVYTGSEKGKPVPSRPGRDMNLANVSSAQLTSFLAHPNVWQRRMAQRILNERRDDKVMGLLQDLFANGHAAEVAPISGPPRSPAQILDTRLAALWTLHSSGYLADDVLARAARDAEPAIRTWAARLIGERQVASDAEIGMLTQLARDSDPSVRLAVAIACRQFTSSHLTVNRPPARPDVALGPVFHALLESSAQADDPVIPFMLWHAAEPVIASRPAPALALLADQGPRFLPLAGQIAGKVMRRLCDLGDAASMDLAIQFIERVLPQSIPLTEFTLDGLIAGQAGKALTPTQGVGAFISTLTAHSNPGIVARGQKLGALWGDAAALQAVLRTASNTAAPSDTRVRAIQTARATKNAAVRDAMLAIIGATNPEPVQIAAIDALGDLGGNEIAEELIRRWKTLSAGARSAAANAMASRRRWALPLLAEVKAGRISASDFGAGVVRTLVNNRDDDVREAAKNAIGRFRESGADKAALVAAKRKVALDGEPNLAAGREVAQRVCLVCHKLHGEGQAVGPDLTGVGRSSLDSLLWNILDPNQVIGAGYEQVEIETKDDRVVAGRLVEDTDARIRLLLIGGKEEVLGKGDVKSRRTLESSVMPEGLWEMPDADLRNMLWYILAPPQEGPLNPEKRERLSSGGGHAGTAPVPRADQESVALWNPEWRIVAPNFEGTPTKLPEYQGRANVLLTHPFNGENPAALERTLDLPSDRSFRLRVAVAAHDQGDWKLRVLADGKAIQEVLVDHGAPRWRTVTVDLKPFAGRRIHLRLENAANDWAWEFGYWADLKIDETGLAAR